MDEERPIEIQEFEEWYASNEKLENQLPYLENFHKQKDGSVFLNFGYLTDERAFQVFCAQGYPQICSLHVRSSSERYSKQCQIINKYIENHGGGIKLGAVFTKCLEVFHNPEQLNVAGPSNAQDSDFEDASVSSAPEIKSDYEHDSCDSSTEAMEIDDSQFFNTEFNVKMDMLKKKWKVKEIELRKKVELDRKAERQKEREKLARNAKYAIKSSFEPIAHYESSDDEDDLDTRSNKTIIPKQGQQIFKHRDATFQILSNEMISFLRDGQDEGFECQTIGDSLYHWDVKISKFSAASRLDEQLKALYLKYAFNYIHIQLDFLPDYPFYPPLLRLVRPRFKGSLVQSLANIDLLKLTYWNPAKGIRDVLRLIRDILSKHAEIDVDYAGNDLAVSKDGAYFPVEDYLIKLALATEITPRANVEIISIENLQKAPQLIDVDKKTPNETAENHTSSAKTNTGWKRGSGYGTGMIHNGRQWSPDSLFKAQEEKDRQILSVLSKLMQELKTHSNNEENEWFEIIEGSCLIPYLEDMLKQASESWIESSRRHKLFSLIFEICDALADSPRLFGLLCRLPRQTYCLAYYLEKLHDIAETGKKLTKKSFRVPSKESTTSIKRKNPDKAVTEADSDLLDLENVELLQNLWEKISRKMSERKEDYSPKTDVKSKEINQDNFESLYKSKLQPLQFRSCSFSKLEGCWRHNYWNLNKPKFSKEVKAIFNEWTALRSSLPISSSTSIFVCYDDENCHLLRALIIAPEDTPYANGCFLFDIQFPVTYPALPPTVNLQTTGGNRVRFNPNLYNNGKVCLSLLGTWSGEQGERWIGGSSTVLQVLVSIQSLIFHERPYFNEPGYERNMGTEKGEEASRNYNKEVRKNCLNVAILGMLTSSPPNFEDIIKLHFTLKKDKVKQQLKQWLEMDSSLDKSVKSVNEILEKLQ